MYVWERGRKDASMFDHNVNPLFWWSPAFLRVWYKCLATWEGNVWCKIIPACDGLLAEHCVILVDISTLYHFLLTYVQCNIFQILSDEDRISYISLVSNFWSIPVLITHCLYFFSFFLFLIRPKKFTLKGYKKAWFVFRDLHLSSYKNEEESNGQPIQRINLKGESVSQSGAKTS